MTELIPVNDRITPSGEKWRVGHWITHLSHLGTLTVRHIEQGGFPYVYAHWATITKQQREYLGSIDSYDHFDYYNMHIFTHDQDAIMFKLLGV